MMIPCGGCGQPDEANRCIGCLHVFKLTSDKGRSAEYAQNLLDEVEVNDEDTPGVWDELTAFCQIRAELAREKHGKR